MPAAALLFILGTRAEAVKALPVMRAMAQRHPRIPVRAGATGQHSMLFDQIAEIEGLQLAWNLEAMAPRRQIPLLVGRILRKLEPVIRKDKPARIVAVGDSASTLAISIAAHAAGVPLAHLEAGLRGTQEGFPFPEEGFRKMVSAVAALHLAPSARARDNLLAEGVAADSIEAAGDPGLDALAEKLAGDARIDDPELAGIDWQRPLALATMSRRENHQDGAHRVCHALERLIDETPDLQIVFPNHLNPRLMEPVRNLLGGNERVRVTLPLPHQVFVNLLRRARIVITDSGGVQEEASALGIPIVSLRAAADRGRAMRAGALHQAGSKIDAVVEMAKKALEPPMDAQRVDRFLSRHRPCAPRIADLLANWMQESG